MTVEEELMKCPNCVCNMVCYTDRKMKEAIQAQYTYLSHIQRIELLKIIGEYLGKTCTQFHITDGAVVD